MRLFPVLFEPVLSQVHHIQQRMKRRPVNTQGNQIEQGCIDLRSQSHVNSLFAVPHFNRWWSLIDWNLMSLDTTWQVLKNVIHHTLLSNLCRVHGMGRRLHPIPILD